MKRSGGNRISLVILSKKSDRSTRRNTSNAIACPSPNLQKGRSHYSIKIPAMRSHYSKK
ncbi:hypothetical protein PN462_00795 [Spirulina sp. CS-785/01]|uniref:hypothetical protein n=1 Tax=Spirulina sp. CS-785/01 TaxID=3021716 RepID=UPI00232DC873|nr:hypothetical protein [Spirulina sp. CS-785/01]MDB9311619.1 hypothetical protein [Spirulina sp. CS-785/01]